MASSVLSNITETKLSELAKKRLNFEAQKASILDSTKAQKDPIAALQVLADGIKSIFNVPTKDGKVVGSSGNVRLETELKNLDRFLGQSHFDPSISQSMIQRWHDSLLRHLETTSLKYTYADLFGKLTMEWLAASKAKSKTTDTPSTSSSQDFEEIATRAKLESRRLWEENVFHPVEVRTDAIENFLNEQFSSKNATKALHNFREEINAFENNTWKHNSFTEYSLAPIIQSLHDSDLLTNEQRRALKDFQSNSTILREIADVLNMRLTGLDSWSWGPDGVVLEQQRQLNGTYNIYMREDLLQAIFLHYIGIKWSVHLKASLCGLMKDSGALDDEKNKVISSERKRREWFFGKTSNRSNVQKVKSSYYRAGYLVSQLLDSEYKNTSTEEGDVEADFEAAAKKKMVAVQAAPAMYAVQAPVQQAPAAYGGARKAKQTARKSTGGMAPRRRLTRADRTDDRAGGNPYDPTIEAEMDYSDEDQGFSLFADEDDDDAEEADGHEDLTAYTPRNIMDAKQRLLHLLSTDVTIGCHLKGGITCFRSQYESWYPLLPHATIRTVLKFFGVSPRWLRFFGKFLEAPLRFSDEDTTRSRRRGVPGSHSISDVLSELVLFCLDFAVNNQAGGDFLWRLDEQIWFWGTDDSCDSAYKTVQTFNKIMGVELDYNKSGSVRLQARNGRIIPATGSTILPKGDIRWGMLVLDPQSGRFIIDREGMVDDHIEELRKQLKEKEKSIFSWIQVYSTYASVFFTSNFGKPANVYGVQKVDDMLATHEYVQRALFAASEGSVTSVVDWLRKEINNRFGVANVPDGFFFFPTELGGLEVKSPFVGLLQIRDSITKEPPKLLDEFEEAEKDQYETLKKKFQERKPYQWQNRSGRGSVMPENPDAFPSFEEFIRYREKLNYGFPNQLLDVYTELLKQPQEQGIEFDHSSGIPDALMRLRSGYTKIQNWYNMTPYWKWIAALYGPEMVEQFGGFDIVDPQSIPISMVQMFQSGRVEWQE